jgi:hypothetical protein
VLISSFGIAVLAYIILCYGILFKGAVQPLSATLLWLLLDGLAAWTAFSSGGNWLLAAGYTVGCALAAVASIYRGKTDFSKSDLSVAALVVICIVVWLGIGNIAGLIASSMAVFIAGVPTMIHYAHRPEEGQLSVWLLFSLANFIGLVGGLRQGYALENWFFPVCAIAGSGIVMFLLVIGWIESLSSIFERE